MSSAVLHEKPFEFLLQNAHHSHTGAPFSLDERLFSVLASSWPSWHKRLYLRKPEFG